MIFFEFFQKFFFFFKLLSNFFYFFINSLNFLTYFLFFWMFFCNSVLNLLGFFLKFSSKIYDFPWLISIFRDFSHFPSVCFYFPWIFLKNFCQLFFIFLWNFLILCEFLFPWFAPPTIVFEQSLPLFLVDYLSIFR